MSKTLEALKDDYLTQLTAQGYAKGTLRNRKCDIEAFLSFLAKQSPPTITSQTLKAYQLKLIASSIEPLTVYIRLTILNAFFAFLKEKGSLLNDIAFPLKRPPEKIITNVLTIKEMQHLLSLPDIRTAKGIRDKAIIELLYSTAIRRSELTRLDLYDINTHQATLRVCGKGNKERILPIGDMACFWVDKYTREARPQPNQSGYPLFLGFIHHRRLTPKCLNLIIAEYAKVSGINKSITPHTFRHSCATHLMQNGADIRYIQELLGHRRATTTQIYTKVSIADLRQVFWQTHPRAAK